MRRTFLLLTQTCLAILTLQASPLAVGVEQVPGLTLHLSSPAGDLVKKPSAGALYGDLTLSLDPGYQFYLEEPGVLLALLGAEVATDDNRRAARDNALRFASPYAEKITYQYDVVSPPDLPSDWWFRYTYGVFHGRGYVAQAPSGTTFPGGLTSWVDPTAQVTATHLSILGSSPYIPLGRTGLFAQAVTGLDMTDLMVETSKTGAGVVAGGLGTLITGPLDLHLLWRPFFFPWVEADGFAGVGAWDFSLAQGGNHDDWPLGYHWGWQVGGGLRWLTLYYQEDHQQQGSMANNAKARTATYDRILYGLRLDLGELFDAFTR